jgi:predicted kinase
VIDEHVVVLITGISASGKSTVAERLAARFVRGVHVRGDAFRRMVVAGRAEMAPEPSTDALAQLHLRYRLGAATADAFFADGFSVVVQDVVLGPALLEYTKLIRSRPLCVVVLAPTADVVRAREAARAKTAYGAGGFCVEDLDAALRRETPPIGLWIDSSAQTPDETVEHIIQQGWAVRDLNP